MSRMSIPYAKFPRPISLVIVGLIAVIATVVILGSTRFLLGLVDGHPVAGSTEYHRGFIHWGTFVVVWLATIGLAFIGVRMWRFGVRRRQFVTSETPKYDAKG